MFHVVLDINSTSFESKLDSFSFVYCRFTGKDVFELPVQGRRQSIRTFYSLSISFSDHVSNCVQMIED
jgi:hypothetical protein